MPRLWYSIMEKMIWDQCGYVVMAVVHGIVLCAGQSHKTLSKQFFCELCNITGVLFFH